MLKVYKSIFDSSSVGWNGAERNRKLDKCGIEMWLK